MHAYKAIAPEKVKFDIKYFYEFCTVPRLRAMFKGYRAMTVVNLADVANEVLIREHNEDAYPEIFPAKKQVPLAGQSDKRLAPAGGAAAGGGLSQSAAGKRKKSGCPSCGRVVAGGYKDHRNSEACMNYARAHKTGSLFTLGIIDAYDDARTPALPVHDDALSDVELEHQEDSDGEEVASASGGESDSDSDNSDSDSDSNRVNSGIFNWFGL